MKCPKGCGRNLDEEDPCEGCKKEQFERDKADMHLFGLLPNPRVIIDQDVASPINKKTIEQALSPKDTSLN